MASANSPDFSDSSFVRRPPLTYQGNARFAPRVRLNVDQEDTEFLEREPRGNMPKRPFYMIATGGLELN